MAYPTELNNYLLFDTSIGSSNLGDEIIMDSVRTELARLLDGGYTRTIPTHLTPFTCFQVLRQSNFVRSVQNCKYKFVGGTNLLVPNLLCHFPQWNVNVFNYKPMTGAILVGVGAGRGAERKVDAYTKFIYSRLLNGDILHSVRDERSKRFVESLGFKAVNTGCATMWELTPEFCEQIPCDKAPNVIFTLNPRSKIDERDVVLIKILKEHYKNIYFWPQGMGDYEYLAKLTELDGINILPATLSAYNQYLTEKDTDYVGTRLHGGIFAIRHKRRAVVISVDERASEIRKCNNLRCIEKNDIASLDELLEQKFPTEIRMPLDVIKEWKSQFGME